MIALNKTNLVCSWPFTLILAFLLLNCSNEDHRTNNPSEQSTKRSEETGAETSDQDSFSLDQFAWSDRPLVVFAPSPEDGRFKKQREMINAAMDKFRERDMVWVQVFSHEGPSKAGDQSITKSEARKLRQSFDVPPGSFAVLLIGKDTTVKRREKGPVAPDGLFEQIDQMPMRKQEMKHRSKENR